MRTSNVGLCHGTHGAPQETLESLEYATKVSEIEHALKKEFEPPIPEPPIYPKEILSNLKNTDHFTENALNHIFDGEINRKGEATGFHYEGIEGSSGSVIPGTRTEPNAKGVYHGNVKVNGVSKRGFSTFFPRAWSPQKIVDSINQAYENRTFEEGSRNTYTGINSNGVTITMFINRNGKIISAFPKE